MKSYTCIEGVTGRVPMEMYLESHVLSRVAFFSWCATLERVLTIYNLRKRGIILRSGASCVKAMGGCQSFIFTLCYNLGDVVYDIQYVENFFSSRTNNLVVVALGGVLWWFVPLFLVLPWRERNARFFEGHKLSARS